MYSGWGLWELCVKAKQIIFNRLISISNSWRIIRSECKRRIQVTVKPSRKCIYEIHFVSLSWFIIHVCIHVYNNVESKAVRWYMYASHASHAANWQQELNDPLLLHTSFIQIDHRTLSGPFKTFTSILCIAI